jgi:hypothetical protein
MSFETRLEKCAFLFGSSLPMFYRKADVVQLVWGDEELNTADEYFGWQLSTSIATG